MKTNDYFGISYHPIIYILWEIALPENTRIKQCKVHKKPLKIVSHVRTHNVNTMILHMPFPKQYYIYTHTYVYKYTFLMLLASIVHRRLARVIAIDGPAPKVQLSIGLGLSAQKSMKDHPTDRG